MLILDLHQILCVNIWFQLKSLFFFFLSSLDSNWVQHTQLTTLGTYLIHVEYDEYKKLLSKKKFKFDIVDVSKDKLF
jgi:hypothetical protein